MMNQYKDIQPIAYKILTKSIKENRFSHAYLIETNGYINSMNFVKSFVKEIFILENKNKKNNICEMIDSDNYPELRIINPDNQWIKKEQLLDLQKEFKNKSLYSNKKIYIINKAEQINEVASNTILKFLEEPQEGIIAILICNNRYNLLETIVSRCQIVSLNNNIGIEESMDIYCKVGFSIMKTKEDYELFLSEEKNKELVDNTLYFIKYFEKNGLKILCYINKYWSNHFKTKEDYYIGLSTLILIYEDILNYKMGIKIKIFQDYLDILETKDTINQIITKINIIYNAIEKINANINLNLLMDKLLIEMDGV